MAHESAIIRLGGDTTGFGDPKMTRAGDFYQESLGDMAHMLSQYGDVIVIRHPATGAAAELARHASVPVINGGDGWGEHPTQSMVDLYTIRTKLGRLDGLHIVLTGDLRMRTIRSLLLGLRHYDCRVSWIAPDNQVPPADLIEEVRTSGLKLIRAADIRERLAQADVVFMEPVIQPDYAVAHQNAPDTKTLTDSRFRIDRALLERAASPRLLLLHALPRQDELATDVDDTPYNGYWLEAANGVIVRMALLDLMLRQPEFRDRTLS